jgi:hypothetical protein
MVKQNSLDRFGSRSAYLTREWLVAIQVPVDGVKPLIDALSEHIPMTQGHYDKCLYVTGPGQQRFHARTGAHAGFEDTVRNSAAAEVTFSIPQDTALLDRVFETVFDAHCNEEPTIRILETWGSRSDSLDGRQNANRSWNSAGASAVRERPVATAYARSA